MALFQPLRMFVSYTSKHTILMETPYHAKAEIRAARQRREELFYELLAQVTGKLTGTYKDLTKTANPELSTNKIQNVRYGRPRDLGVLIKIVQASLPGFTIAEKFLSALADENAKVTHQLIG